MLSATKPGILAIFARSNGSLPSLSEWEYTALITKCSAKFCDTVCRSALNCMGDRPAATLASFTLFNTSAPIAAASFRLSVLLLSLAG